MMNQGQANIGQDATDSTRLANAAALTRLPFDDTQDVEDAQRGFIAGLTNPVITGADGRPVWDSAAYAFEDAEAPPDTVHPSLWRQARLNRIAGLFTVVDRLYQIRGLDLSNMSIIEGETGLIVIDPLISTECAAAGIELYYQHRGQRPIIAVIYTHSHADHYGGVKGVVSEDEVAAGKVRIYAPFGFMAHVASENLFAGNAMSRRAQYQYGAFLPKGPGGQVDLGLGEAVSTGTITLIAPTDIIEESHTTRTIDGVTVGFQLTPGTEAPAEMNFDYLGIRLNGEKAADTPEVVLNWKFSDLQETYVLTLRNATLTYRSHAQDPEAAATITIPKSTLDAITVGGISFERAIEEKVLTIDGDASALISLLGLLDTFELMFNIVEP